ncbi:hypothetical protein [Psychrobacter sp. Ps6]|uniref:hypothetical protein n=1 Tax=Psychrobacter sp. Ps6 TaxID=2790960 RepID=UPI001EE13A34|nr:hypothetical protein [Psychrobacter sp. Ps6]MCG3879461.1 hypothetical protein [Psychrobacter sp. Ps6]
MKRNDSIQFNNNVVDVTQRLIQGYNGILEDIFERNEVKLPEKLDPRAAEMFVYMSAHMSLKIDEKAEVYEDYTNAINCLVLSDCLTVCEKSNIPSNFDPPTSPDSWVKSAFTLQMIAELNREQTSRIVNGMWKFFYDKEKDKMHACLTKSKRKSVLMSLDSTAKKDYFNSLLSSDHNFDDLDSQYYAYSNSSDYLTYLTQSEPESWKVFSETLGVSVDVLSALAGFLVFLDFASKEVNHSFWYDEQFLETLYVIYSQAWPKHGVILNGRIVELISMFAMKPSESSRYLLPIPFYKLHGKFLRNPAFIKFQDISIGLLTILIRNNENLWSKTLGSTLAKAADQILSTLPKFPNIKAAVRKKFNGGDIDLALYDINTGHMLSIEIKTVYDKHKVDSLLHRFVNSKVNLPKAIKQIRQTDHIISSGSVNMKDIFGENLNQPIKVHNMLLTWFDPIDLTIGTPDDDIFSLNFTILRMMLTLSEGDLELLTRSVHELRNIWLLSRDRDLDLGQESLDCYLEEQVNIIDLREDLSTLDLSKITMKVLNLFTSLSDVKEDNNYYSYFKDTQDVLS